MTEQHHDILPRIIAMLLALAMVAEHAARRPLAMRLSLCDVLLPAHFAALTLLDLPDEDALRQTSFLSKTGDSAAALIHLAMVLRAVAAVLMHACLTSGTPRSAKPRHAAALSLNLAARPLCRRFLNATGFVHDTS